MKVPNSPITCSGLISILFVNSRRFLQSYCSTFCTILFLSSSAQSATRPETDLVPLHIGINEVDFGERAIAGMVVLAHRENFNAHSSELATFYLRTAVVESDPEMWQIIPFEIPRKEKDQGVDKNYLRVWGGADCKLETFRLLRGRNDKATYVLRANRPLGHSFVDPGFVTFVWFKLDWNLDGVPGWPVALFKVSKTETSKSKYCDVDKAIETELHLRGAITPTEGSLPDQPE